MAEELLGIKVHTELKTAGIGEWWDLSDRIRLWTDYLGGLEKHHEAIQGRFIEGKKGTLLEFLKACNDDKKKADKNAVKQLRVNLSMVPKAANPEDKKRLGKPSPLRHKSIDQLDKLLPGIKTKFFQRRIDKALSCVSHESCKVYHKQILDLLKIFGNARIVAYDAESSSFQENKIEYGFDKLPNQVKVQAQKRMQKRVKPDAQVTIALYAQNKVYLKDDSEFVHAEILGGILFEAGNVYKGVPDLSTDKRPEAEIPVTLFNSLQAAIRAKSGFAITQTEWRNLIPLFFSDVDISTFYMSNKYSTFWKETRHGVGRYKT